MPPTKTFVPAGASGSSGRTAAPVAGLRNRRPAGPAVTRTPAVSASPSTSPVELENEGSAVPFARRRVTPVPPAAKNPPRPSPIAAPSGRGAPVASASFAPLDADTTTARTCGSAAAEAAGASVSSGERGNARRASRARGFHTECRTLCGSC